MAQLKKNNNYLHVIMFFCLIVGHFIYEAHELIQSIFKIQNIVTLIYHIHKIRLCNKILQTLQ